MASGFRGWVERGYRRSGAAQSYTYSPWGQRLSQLKHDGASGDTETSFYGYNPHTDVETLTTDTGDARATYGYTAYGSDDEAEFTGVDAPDAGTPGAEPYNVYRYSGKRWDAASGTYDMGFRDYAPGLNRFLSRDMYNGALADLNLSMSPWTGNRYAFTGGNPIGLVELDGHAAVAIDGGGISGGVQDPDSYVLGQDSGSPTGGCYVLGVTSSCGSVTQTTTGGYNGINSATLPPCSRCGWDATGDGLVEAWERTATTFVYTFDNAVRRWSNLPQTAWDATSGTVLLEDLTAYEAIIFEGSRLKRDGEYCRVEANCLVGVGAPGGATAITLGHTIRFEAEDPLPSLVGHEMQHVYDIEHVGGIPFYGSYGTDSLGLWMTGQDAYQGILWEKRAYDVSDNWHNGARPRGLFSW